MNIIYVNATHIMETLYKKNKTNKIQVYTSWTRGAKLYSQYGELGGKMQVSSITCEGKNIGKINETTPEEQAILEGKAKCQLKRDKGYFDTIEEAQTEVVFLPMLAKDGRKVKITYPCYAQPKLDGVRCMATKNGLMSRGGKPYNVKHIEEELKTVSLGNTIPDGELYIHGMPLQDLVSLVKKPKLGSENIEYWIYDIYNPKVIDASWSTRMFWLGTRNIMPHIKFVSSIGVNNEAEMKTLHDKFVQEGYEGIILRSPKGLYELGHRSKHLIKYKEFIDAEFEIIGYSTGKGKFEDCVIWKCITKDKKVFDVSPKGTLEQKRQWYESAAKYIGKQLTVRYQALTNDGIPQFPVGIVIRDY